jgi:hypothetical protein
MTATKADLAENLHDAKARPCADCGVQYPIHVMQLDHRPGSGKLFGCGDPLWGHPSPGLVKATAILGSVEAAMRAEIAKCDTVCANCHAERTYRRRAELARARPPVRVNGCLTGEAYCRHGLEFAR